MGLARFTTELIDQPGVQQEVEQAMKSHFESVELISKDELFYHYKVTGEGVPIGAIYFLFEREKESGKLKIVGIQ